MPPYTISSGGLTTASDLPTPTSLAIPSPTLPRSPGHTAYPIPYSHPLTNSTLTRVVDQQITMTEPRGGVTAYEFWPHKGSTPQEQEKAVHDNSVGAASTRLTLTLDMTRAPTNTPGELDRFLEVVAPQTNWGRLVLAKRNSSDGGKNAQEGEHEDESAQEDEHEKELAKHGADNRVRKRSKGGNCPIL